MTNKLKRKVVLIVVVTLIISLNMGISIKAYTDINFKNMTIEDGLSQATVETLLQDSKGYIWIGTNDGLNRYNGYNYTVFTQDEGSPNNIVNNYIVDLKEDKQGNIWVGTANGVSKIHNDGQTITNYYTDEDKGNLSNYNVGDIIVLDDGDVLIGTSDGLNLYVEETDSFKRILDEDGQLTDQLIYSIAEDINGYLWIGTRGGLDRVDIKNKSVENYPITEDEDSISKDSVYKVFCDKNGDVWIGTFTNGVSRIDVKNNKIMRYYHDINDENSLPGNHVRNFYRDSKDNLWVCTSEGLANYNEENNNFKTYTNKVYDKRSLVDDSTFVIMEDNSGLLWIGTYSGISVFDPANKIRHYKNDPFDKNTINDNMVQGIYEDNDGLLWVGTNSKGLNIIDRKNDIVKSLSINSNIKLSSNRVNDISGYGEYIFIGTNNGLNILNKNNKILDVYTEEDGLASRNIKNLLVDTTGHLWIGTVDGFNIFNPKDGTIIDLNLILNRVEPSDTYSGAIFEDSDGVYWIGNFLEGGLTKIDPHNKELTNYKYNELDKNSIGNNSIRSIAEDDFGDIWIGTSLGLNKFNKETEKFERFTVKDGLPNNTIYGIIIDDNNNPWVSTNLGLSRYDIENDRFINLNTTDGLQSNEFNGESYLKTKDGEFFFGGINGLNSFFPEEITDNTYISEVIFDEFYVNGIKHGNIDGEKFESNENNISIRVFLPAYKNSKNITYYYKLNGIDNEWIMMDNNEVLFSNLSSGNYDFRVIARNSNGMVSEKSSINFTINRPFLLSNVAIAIYILMILFIIYMNKNKVNKLDTLVDVRTNKLRAEMKKNTELFNKVIELERGKNSYFINLSHELRTPLNVLHTTEQLITKLNSEGEIKKDKLDYYMMVIRKNNKRLLKLINNLIDISKIEHGNYQIKFEDVDIVYLVEETSLGLKDYVEEKGIAIIIDPEIEEKIIKCDSQEIERCIVNLISNAIKFTPKGGTIKVIIEDLDKNVKITVSDTGCGINPIYHEAIFNRFDQVVDQNSEVKGGSGLGLTITKQIVELHNGIIYVESEMGIGSKFNIILPVNIDGNESI